MAKVVGNSRKTSFGKRKSGKAFKAQGPKAKPVKKNRGQGR